MFRAIENRQGNLESRYRGKKCYFLTYTVLFAVVSFLVFSWYFLEGRTFIWESDGWTQHYKALIYYARYLRSIVYSIFVEHRFHIPEWDFNIGEGNDILGTLHYYVIGDPFAVLSVLVPTRFMYVYYDIMILLRLYLAGIAFSCLCFGTGQKSRCAVLAGSMVYVFCYWAIFNAARHPYFLNPMVYLPMMVLGIERMLKKEKPYLFIATVFLSAVSNFYFFYMIVLVTVIYAVVRVIAFYQLKNWKDGLFMLFRLSAASILGLLMAGVVFLPMCYVFLNDARMSAGNAVPFLYPASYYAKLFSGFINVGHPYWMCMGYAAPTLAAVILLFIKKRHNMLKVLFILCVTISAVPFLGHALNGFSYVANRWCWAFALVSAYIMVAMWPHLMQLTKREGLFLAAGMMVYSLVCLFFDKERTGSMHTELLLAFLFLLAVLFLGNGGNVRWRCWKSSAALFLVMVSIVNISFWKNSVNGDNYASQSKKVENLLPQLTQNEIKDIRNTADSEGTGTFYRYSGDKLSINAGVLAGLSSTQYYWTLSNPYVFEARSALGLREVSAYRYFGYDDRTVLTTLAAVRYYALPSGSQLHLPYGFTKAGPAKPVSKQGDRRSLNMFGRGQATQKYLVYRNSCALPLAYTYDSYLSTGRWRKLSDVGKQEAMLQRLILEKDDYRGSLKEADPVLTGRKVQYEIKCNDENVVIHGRNITVKKPHSTVTLKFKGLPESETYLSIHGMHFKGVKAENAADDEDEDGISEEPAQTCLSLRSSAGIKKKLTYYTEKHRAYDNRHDFSVNLCYTENAADFVRIAFSKAGTYTFDSLDITCQPMEQYTAEIEKRREITLQNITAGNDEVNGTIYLEKPKLLCLAIPFSAGWRAYVDGRETTLYRANVMYMALDVGKGRHSIKLEYHTPLLKEGICISVFAFVLLGLIRLGNGKMRGIRGKW